MTSHGDIGYLRSILTALGRALRRGILGRSSHDHIKQFTASDEYWGRVLAAQLGWPLEQPKPNVRGTARDPWEPEYEPVHGWTRRQLRDYLRRNPGYRRAYEAELQHRGHRVSASPSESANQQETGDSRLGLLAVGPR